MKLFIFSENTREAKEIEVGDQPTPKEVLTASKHLIPDNEPSEVHLFLEDNEENEGRPSDGWKPKPKDRIHCHRCPHVDVELVYNGTSKHTEFSPATTGARILATLPKLFPGISPRDAANLQLEISANNYLDKNEHLGSFVAYPHCHLRISVTPKTNVQG